MRTKSRKAGDTETLELITSRIKSGNGLIARAYEQDLEFQSLCQDFRECKKALEAWQASDAAVAAQRLREYSQMLEELEQEICGWLKDMGAET